MLPQHENDDVFESRAIDPSSLLTGDRHGRQLRNAAPPGMQHAKRVSEQDLLGDRLAVLRDQGNRDSGHLAVVGAKLDWIDEAVEIRPDADMFVAARQLTDV